MSELKSIDESSFEKAVLKSDRPVLVDFWAEWCGPCKALGPILSEIAAEMEEKVSIVKMNVDENQTLVQKYGIRGIPTLMFFKEGEIQSTLVGNQPKAEILKNLNNLIT